MFRHIFEALTPSQTVALVNSANAPLRAGRSIINALPADKARGRAVTKDIWINNGRMILEVRVAHDVDPFTGFFDAIHLGDGQPIRIDGTRIVDSGPVQGVA